METEALEMIFEPLPSSDLQRFLEDNVIGFVQAQTGTSDWHPVGFFLRNRRGEWLGGCIGSVWGGWLQVRWLWVTEFLRGKGHGAQLLAAAEAMAADRGATHATLETHNPAAREFYLRHGYTVFGALENYPPGHAKFFLRKTLENSRTSR